MNTNKQKILIKITHSKEQISFFWAQFPDSPDDGLTPTETSLFISHNN